MNKSDSESRTDLMDELEDQDKKVLQALDEILKFFKKESRSIADPLTGKIWDILWSLNGIYIYWFPTKPSNAMLEELFKPAFVNEKPDISAKNFSPNALRDSPVTRSSGAHQFFQLVRAVTCCAEALKRSNTDIATDRDEGWLYTHQASNFYHSLSREAGIYDSIYMSQVFNKSEFARKGAIARIERDPKQKEKSFIFGCWQQWQQSPSVYGSKAAFARDMLTKCEYLTSQKKIEDWCREWEKPNHAG